MEFLFLTELTKIGLRSVHEYSAKSEREKLANSLLNVDPNDDSSVWLNWIEVLTFEFIIPKSLDAMLTVWKRSHFEIQIQLLCIEKIFIHFANTIYV